MSRPPCYQPPDDDEPQDPPEEDPYVNPIGVAPAIANAVYHATGKRVRDLPITIEKLMSWSDGLQPADVIAAAPALRGTVPRIGCIPRAAARING